MAPVFHRRLFLTLFFVIRRRVLKYQTINRYFSRLNNTFSNHIYQIMPKRKAAATKVVQPENQSDDESVEGVDGLAGGDGLNAVDTLPKKKEKATKVDKVPKGKSAKQKMETNEKSEEKLPRPRRAAAAKAKVVESDAESEDDDKPKRRAATKKPKPADPDGNSKDGPPKQKKSRTNKVDKKETAKKGGNEPADEMDDDEKEDGDKIEDANKKGATKKKAAGKKKVEKKNDDDDEEEKTEKPVMNQTSTNYSKINLQCTKKNAKGQDPNLKISSWNVDGLRAWLKKDGLTYITKEDPDILCLQETKCSIAKIPEEIKSIKGYETYWVESDKEGYAGVALLSKQKPIDVKYGIGIEDHDGEGRIITAEFQKFYVISVYVPNAGRKLVTLPKRLDWNDAFKSFIKELEAKKPVIICGDMNVAHQEIDLSNPKTNKKNAGFTQEERDGMTDFLEAGYSDSFRNFYPDLKDSYTFWTYLGKARSKNVGWRLDYFLVSNKIMGNICDSVIRDQIFGSDHCPIVLFLNV